MAMFQELGQLLSGSGALGAASTALGSEEEGTRSAFASAVPLLLGSLGKRAGNPAGASALFDMVKGQDGSILNNLGGALSGADDGGFGGSLVDGLLGGNKENVTQGLSQQSGLGVGQITKLLPMLAPIVMGFLGKKQTDGNLDQAGLAGSLANERVAMESAGFGSMLGLLDSGNAEQDDQGFLANMGSRNLGAGTLGKVAGVGGLAAGGTAAASKLTGAASGATDGLTNGLGGAAGKLTGGAAAAAGGVTNGATGAAAKLTGGAAGKAPSTAVRNTTGKAGVAASTVATPVIAHDEKRKRGAMWLLPLLLLGVIGLGLWAAFNGGDDEDTAATADTAATTTQIEEMADEAEEAADEAAMADDSMEEEAAEEAVEEAPADGFAAGNILDAGEKDGQVSGFLGAVTATGLSTDLDGEGPFTIFAPSDEALASLPDSIKNDPETLERVLRNHVVEGDYPADALVDGPLTSLDGSPLNVALGSGSPVINGANVVTANLAGGNGTMHVIDRVLLPADLISNAGGSLNEALGIQPINFEVGSAVITADSTAVLDGAAEFLIANNTVVEIAGHTDADGDDALNLALSQDRAESVMTYLTDKGVTAENMTAVGYGETQPIASNDTTEGKAENRRIEFVAAAS